MLNLNGNQNIKNIPVEEWKTEKDINLKEWEIKKINIENCGLETLPLIEIINTFPRLSKISASKNNVQIINKNRIEFTSHELKTRELKPYQNHQCKELSNEGASTLQTNKRNTIELDLSRNNISQFPSELFNSSIRNDKISSPHSIPFKIPLKLILIKNVLNHAPPKKDCNRGETTDHLKSYAENHQHLRVLGEKNQKQPRKTLEPSSNTSLTSDNNKQKNQKWDSNCFFTLSQLQISDNPNLCDLQFLNQLSTESLSSISSLTITNCDMQQFNLNQTILSAISPSLVRLNLSFNKSLDLNTLFKEIEHFQHLRDLNLSYVSTKENPMFFPHQSLCSIGDRLRSLNLSHNYFISSTTQNSMLNNNSDHSRCCCHCCCSQKGDCSFGFIIPSSIYFSMCELQVLQLSHCHLIDFETLKYNNNNNNNNNNNISPCQTNKGNNRIEKNRIFPKLTTLNLDNNHLQKVPSIVKYCPSLSKVSLSNNKMNPLSVSFNHNKNEYKHKSTLNNPQIQDQLKIEPYEKEQNQRELIFKDNMMSKTDLRDNHENNDLDHVSSSLNSEDLNNSGDLIFNSRTLQTLNLSDNPRMMEGHHMPVHLTSSLSSLSSSLPAPSSSLSSSSLIPRNRSLCPYMGKTLSVLDLSNTGLHGKFPSVLVLQNIPQLILLNVSNNQLSSFLEEKDSNYIFQNESKKISQSRLKTLHLEHNHISSLSSGLTRIAPKLKLIGLRGNPIQQLPRDLASIKENPNTSCRIHFLKQDTPDQILQYLYLGSSESGLSAKLLRYLRITHIISLGVQFQTPRHPKEFKYLVIPIADRSDVDISKYFSECIDFIEEAKLWNTRCLVHCQMGRSRSVTIVMAYLMCCFKMTVNEAYDWIQSKRPQICPNSGFLNQLLQMDKNMNKNS